MTASSRASAPLSAAIDGLGQEPLELLLRAAQLWRQRRRPGRRAASASSASRWARVHRARSGTPAAEVAAVSVMPGRPPRRPTTRRPGHRRSMGAGERATPQAAAGARRLPRRAASRTRRGEAGTAGTAPTLSPWGRCGSEPLSWTINNSTRRSPTREQCQTGRHPGPDRGGARRPPACPGPRHRGRRDHPGRQAPDPARRRRQGRRGDPRRRRRGDPRGLPGARRVRRDGRAALHARGHLARRRPAADPAAPLAPQRRPAGQGDLRRRRRRSTGRIVASDDDVGDARRRRQPPRGRVRRRRQGAGADRVQPAKPDDDGDEEEA